MTEHWQLLTSVKFYPYALGCSSGQRFLTHNGLQDPGHLISLRHTNITLTPAPTPCSPCATILLLMKAVLVKVQFRGPKLYKKKGALFQEESYLPRIFRSSSLNLHTFHLMNIVFWWQIFFRKHGKSTPNDRQDHHVLVVDIVTMTSQCRCTRAPSQSHVVKHDNHVPETPLIGSGTGCHVDAMAAVWPNHIGKNIKIIFKLRPSMPNRIANLFAKP